jgi:hypothetical protein
VTAVLSGVQHIGTGMCPVLDQTAQHQLPGTTKALVKHTFSTASKHRTVLDVLKCRTLQPFRKGRLRNAKESMLSSHGKDDTIAAYKGCSAGYSASVTSERFYVKP